MTFAHLHTHTVFSFGDGACRIDELVAEAARLEMPALAVTDHEGLYGAVRFYQACQAAGIKPIAIGRGKNGAIRYKWNEVEAWLQSQQQVE